MGKSLPQKVRIKKCFNFFSNKKYRKNEKKNTTLSHKKEYYVSKAF